MCSLIDVCSTGPRRAAQGHLPASVLGAGASQVQQRQVTRPAGLVLVSCGLQTVSSRCCGSRLWVSL